jgi:4-amino-4-deoxy-L-arabinose transferase-like glycosyltransferase
MAGRGETQHGQAGPRLWWVGLGIVIAGYCVLAAMQSYATRLQWGPDEPAHIIYVRSLALDVRLPSLARTETEHAYAQGRARTHQAHHPPLYYALAAALWRVFEGRPEQTVSYTDTASGQVVSFAVPGPVRPVRFLSVLLGAVTLLLAWATARTVFPDRPAVCLAGVALAAFTPMFTYVHGVINNDPLLICLFAATAWQWARIMRFGAAMRDVLVLGLLVGVAINAKETAIALVPLSLVAIALAPGTRSWPQRLTRMAALAGIVVLLAGWWYARKWMVHGSPFVYPYYTPLLGLPDDERQARLMPLPATVFLFTFVPADVIGPSADLGMVARFFVSLVTLSIGGLLLLWLRARKQPLARFETGSLALWLLAALLVLAGLARNVLLIDWRMGPAGGRYLQPVVSLLALASARGLSALFGDQKWAAPALVAVCLLLVAMNVYTIWATAEHYGTLGR